MSSAEESASEADSRIPPIHGYTMDLTMLTDEEEDALMAVLEKDAVFTGTVEGKISELRDEILLIRQKGALIAGDKQSKICARCKFKFWSPFCPFGDHGKPCVNCRFKVCKKCRFLQESNTTWICSLCLKQRQEKNLTGGWLHKYQCLGLHGSDLLRASMRDRGLVTVLPTAAIQTVIEETDRRLNASPPTSSPRGRRMQQPPLLSTPPSSSRGRHVRHGRAASSSAVSTASSLEIPLAYRRVRSHQSHHDTDGSSSVTSSISSGGCMRRRRNLPSPRKEESEEDASSNLPKPDLPHRVLPAHPVETTSLVSGKHRKSYSQAQEKASVKVASPGKDAHSFLPEVEGSMSHSTDPDRAQSEGISVSSLATTSSGSLDTNTLRGREEEKSEGHSAGSKGEVNDLGKKSSKHEGSRSSRSSKSLQSESVKCGDVGADQKQKEKFEEVYDQKVNSLVDMMTKRPTAQSRANSSQPKVAAKRGTLLALAQEANLTDSTQSGHLTNDTESVRDSDSGVPSSHHSRTNTPEHRGPQPRPSPNNRQRGPPAIAVTATKDERYREEEDDDLDDLFNQHRPNMLGSRSSLADSRESIYSVYSDAGEVNYGRIPVTGDINFNLAYNTQAMQLEVHIKQCRDLAPVDTKHNRSDPYVKTYLLPDKTRGGKRKTKIKKHTLNPSFNEVLKYTISRTELESRTLWITVWHNDRFGRNDFLGEVTVPLDYYNYDDDMPRWYQLQERLVSPDDTSLMTYKGDLSISLKYVPADMVEGGSGKKKSGSSKRKSKDKDKAKTGALGEVHVLVREAQNLTAMRGASGGSNPFCKGYLLPDESHTSKQKTPVLKKTVNPKWSHILVFDGVDQKQLATHAVELTIWDHEKLSSNDFLGGVRLNLGEGMFHGKPVDWMDARGEEIEVWNSMIAHPNEWVDAQLPLRASMGNSNVKK